MTLIRVDDKNILNPAHIVRVEVTEKVLGPGAPQRAVRFVLTNGEFVERKIAGGRVEDMDREVTALLDAFGLKR